MKYKIKILIAVTGFIVVISGQCLWASWLPWFGGKSEPERPQHVSCEQEQLMIDSLRTELEQAQKDRDFYLQEFTKCTKENGGLKRQCNAYKIELDQCARQDMQLQTKFKQAEKDLRSFKMTGLAARGEKEIQQLSKQLLDCKNELKEVNALKRSNDELKKENEKAVEQTVQLKKIYKHSSDVNTIYGQLTVFLKKALELSLVMQELELLVTSPVSAQTKQQAIKYQQQLVDKKDKLEKLKNELEEQKARLPEESEIALIIEETILGYFDVLSLKYTSLTSRVGQFLQRSEKASEGPYRERSYDRGSRG